MQVSIRSFRHFLKKIASRTLSMVKREPTTWQRVSREVRQLGYDWSEFDIQHFVQWLSQVRERKILLVPYPISGNVGGLWLTSDTTEFIIYSDQLAGAHRDHVILHEIGHLILGHETLNIDAVDSIEDIIFNLPSDGVAMRKIALAPLSQDKEIEAETFAILVLGRIADENLGIVSDGLKHLHEEFR